GAGGCFGGTIAGLAIGFTALARRLAGPLGFAIGLLDGGQLILGGALASALTIGTTAALATALRCATTTGRQTLAFAHHAEVDLAGIEIHPTDLHAHAGTDAVAHATALTAQFLARFVKAVVLAAKFGDVDQALDIQAIQLHEQAEARGRADGAAVLLAQPLAHEH